MESIYQQAKEQMNETEIDHHLSDLYLKVTDVSRKLISEYEYRKLVKNFTSHIDKQSWYEIPFAFDPYWDKIK